MSLPAGSPEGSPSGAHGEPVLRVQGLGKRYGSREALRKVSFAASAGEMVAVIGPNGAGKTTLLSILGGVQAPSSGTVARTGAIGWVPQQPALYSKLAVAENLRLFARLERVEDPEAVVARMLEQTGLTDRASERVERLSGGNRQRVNVALGLLAGPPVILLDEPSSSLDPSQRERLWQFIESLAAAGTSVLFSTHIVGEAERYAHRVIVLDDGALLFDGPPAQLKSESGQEDFERAVVSFLRGAGATRQCRPPRAGVEMKWLLAKDLLILRRSRLLVALLVIYPVAIALLIGFAISASPSKPRVAIVDETPPGETVTLGGTRIGLQEYTDRLFNQVHVVRVPDPRRGGGESRLGRRDSGDRDPAGHRVEDLLGGEPGARGSDLQRRRFEAVVRALHDQLGARASEPRPLRADQERRGAGHRPAARGWGSSGCWGRRRTSSASATSRPRCGASPHDSRRVRTARRL